MSEIALQTRGLTMQFGGLKAVSELDLEIPKGAIFGLIGPNGAGKTTLFNVVSRLYECREGSLAFDGRDLLALPPHRIARVGIARTFQNLALFPALSVLDNVLLGGYAHGAADAKRRAEALGIGDLLDERTRRRPVAVLGEKPTANGQPLLQEVYFLEKALDPYVSLTIGDRETVLNRSTAVLLIPDGAAPSTVDRDEIAKWIERGGVAVRFAGPNLAQGNDGLVPTPLRLGDRALGGVMSWGQPSALAEFPANSPFLGIPVPKDVRIQQQVLAEPTPDLADKTWARLADGTPLVTAEKRGQGYLVLFHTTANTTWSNMALSGLFVNMLQRLVILSRGVAGDGVNKSLKPWRTLDGFGKLGAPPAGARQPS